MKLRPIMLTALLPLAAACAPTDGDGGRNAIRAPAATALGEPESCITISNIRNTNVWDNSTIDFETAGGRTYRNTLPNSCSGLGFEERFTYETSLSRLCSTDIIYVLDSSGQRRGGCGLGQFVPVEVAKR